MFLVILKIIICILQQCNSNNVFFPEKTETFLGDSCHKNSSGINGTCRLIQDCPSARENVTPDLRTQICGFMGNGPLVCCVDDVPSTVEIFTPNMISMMKSLPLVSRQEAQRISLQKCLEYKNRVYPNDDCPHLNKSAGEFGKVSAEKHPYFAMVGYEFLENVTWGCHGELLSELYVLTPDSCLNNFVYGAPKFVRLGGNLSIPSDYDEEQVQLIEVEEAIKYPKDLSPGISNKIALLKLGKPAVLNRFVVPICLPTSDNVQSVLASTDWRYNFREETELYDTHLREVTMVEVPFEKCKETYGEEVQDIHVCARIRNRTEYQCAAKGGLITPHSKIQCMYGVVGF